MTEMDLATVDHLLSTTRSVRKRLDLERPVSRELLMECLRLAIQAPTGSNSQSWRWLVVTDADKRARLAELYRRAFTEYTKLRANDAIPRGASAHQMERIFDSATYLTENLHRAPVHVVPCVVGRVDGLPNFVQASIYGSVLPAVWSFMLAARSRGLGSAWTTLHLQYEAQAAELLGIPEHVMQVALLPVAHFTGDDFKPAARRPVEELTYFDAWKQA